METYHSKRTNTNVYEIVRLYKYNSQTVRMLAVRTMMASINRRQRSRMNRQKRSTADTILNKRRDTMSAIIEKMSDLQTEA